MSSARMRIAASRHRPDARRRLVLGTMCLLSGNVDLELQLFWAVPHYTVLLYSFGTRKLWNIDIAFRIYGIAFALLLSHSGTTWEAAQTAHVMQQPLERTP
jgi:hypothetical protein